jgi:UDP-glucose 4-epimerase
METIVGTEIKRTYLERARGDARDTSAEISKAEQILQYVPQVNLGEGLSREWEWMKSKELANY